jgi:hypothetical protein
MTGFAITRFAPDGQVAAAHRGRACCATTRPPTGWRSTACASRPPAPTAGRRWPPRARPWPMAMAARSSCWAVPRSSANGPAATRWRCAANSCMPSWFERCGRTCRCRCAMVAPRPGPAGWNTTTCNASCLLARCAPPCGPVLHGHGRQRAGGPLNMTSHGPPAGLHHRRLQRHRPGAGAALRTAPAGAWPWWRRRADAGAAWAAAQGWRPADLLAVLAADVRDVDAITAAGRRLHGQPGPARRGDRLCRHQRGHGHRRASPTWT